MPSNSFLTPGEIAEMGFKAVGNDVRISRHATFYGAGRMSIGNHSRIDDFSVLSAGRNGFLSVGSYVHIAAHVIVYASTGITLSDFSGLSAGCIVYGSTDDFVYGALTNPTVPEEFRDVRSGDVFLGKHCVVGCGTVIMPGVILGEGSSVGALSFVSRDVNPGDIVVGRPARRLGSRDMARLAELEKRLLDGTGATQADRSV
jgi:acetyltransferase-like isoleucine patch superfamily enzyme